MAKKFLDGGEIDERRKAKREVTAQQGGLRTPGEGIIPAMLL